MCCCLTFQLLTITAAASLLPLEIYLKFCIAYLFLEQNPFYPSSLTRNVCPQRAAQPIEKIFLRKNIVAVSFFQNCAIHPYS